MSIITLTHRDFCVVRVTGLQLPAERQHGVCVVFSCVQQFVVLDRIFMDFSFAVCKIVLQNEWKKNNMKLETGLHVKVLVNTKYSKVFSFLCSSYTDMLLNNIFIPF